MFKLEISALRDMPVSIMSDKSIKAELKACGLKIDHITKNAIYYIKRHIIKGY